MSGTPLRATAILGILAGVGCAPAVLSPEGPAAGRIAWLIKLFTVLTAAPAAVTIGLLLAAALGRKRGARVARSGTWIVLGTGITTALLWILLVASVRAGTEVAAPAGPTAVTIDVRGHQFWWEVRYPDHGVTTANEIHIPVGRPVRLRLTSADVVHNFWVPELHGKMDMVPGQTNVFWMQADRSGAFLGRCAEFCGVQHALMQVLVVAEPAEAFSAWLAAQRAPAEPPSEPQAQRGLVVFHAAQCGHCHAVQGQTPPLETGAVGPDLTHLSSRRTLGAAILPNNRGNLAGWILDPQHHKPGNRMPPSTLAPDDLMALLTYLEGLR